MSHPITEIDCIPCGDLDWYVRDSKTLEVLAGPYDDLDLARIVAEHWSNRLPVDLVSGAYV